MDTETVNETVQQPTETAPRRKKYITGRAMPIYFIALAFSVIAMLMQSISVLFCYDPAMQVYKHGSVFGTVTMVVITVFVVLYSVGAILMTGNLRKLKLVPPTTTLTAFISASMGVFTVIASVAIYIQSRASSSTEATMSVLMAVMSVPTCAYYVLSAMKKENRPLLSILGFTPVLWTVLCLLRIYFEKGVAINDPVRVFFQLSFVAILLSVLLELKTRLGKRGTPNYVAAMGSAVIIGLPSAISMLLLFIIPRTVTVAELLLTVAQLLFTLYQLSRLHTNLKCI